MANLRPIVRRQHPTSGTGSVLLEAVLAATTALVALAIIAPMFARQLELTRRARDTDLVEMAVNQDINAIRQIVRYMRMRSGPYSRGYIYKNAFITGLSSGYNQTSYIQYEPASIFECTSKNSLNRIILDDLKQYKFAGITIVNYPRVLGLAEDITPPSSALKGRYKLTRTLESVPDSSVPTLRMRYALQNLGSAAPLAFERSAELQVEIHNGC